MARYCFGRKPHVHDPRTLKFGDYALVSLPEPKVSVSILKKVYMKLGISDPTVLFPLDGNSSLEDCTIALAAHATTVFAGVVGIKNILPENAVIDLYNALTNNVNDGLEQKTVLNYWRQTGIGNEKILAYVSIDPKNHTHVKQAIELCNGIAVGLDIQQDTVAQFEARRPWTPSASLGEGHAVYGVEYDDAGVTVLTWGNTQKGTWDWWDSSVQEAYAIIPPQAHDQEFSPGFDTTTLRSDLKRITSRS